MSEQQNYQILLYYKFVQIPDPEAFKDEHLQYCKDLGLKGRILVASEGINGTVSGTIEQTEQYMQDMHANPLFADMVFKIDPSEGHAFKRCLSVTAKNSLLFVSRMNSTPTRLAENACRPRNSLNTCA